MLGHKLSYFNFWLQLTCSHDGSRKVSFLSVICVFSVCSGLLFIYVLKLSKHYANIKGYIY